jgi:oxygen-independent coproporphyrinogen-3 oxidase
MASIYVHFPWCLAKCPYCDFVSYAKERDDIDHAGYADAVLREATMRAEQLRDRDLSISSVFFGGGTPSLWAPEEIARVLAGLRERFRFASGLEVTVECNPTSLDEDRARRLVAAGVDRLSIGTQSLRAEQLRFLGRLHDADGARRAVAAAGRALVPRVSTDLIFGLPDQPVTDAVAQAMELVDLGLRHLSCYQLTIEPGTQFGERRKRGLLPMADDGEVAASFLAIDEALTERGLAHYEISNYAVPGEEARHNVSYWRGDEYVGLGCAAFGFARTKTGAGVRWRNPILPADYVARTQALTPSDIGEDDGLTSTAEPLDAKALLRERIMLGLRMAAGVDLGRAGRELGVDPWTAERRRAVEKLVTRERLAAEGETLRIPRAAWLFADDTAARLF